MTPGHLTVRAANPSHALALVIVDELARCGVTDAVLAPGSRSAALAMALHAEARIRLHVQIDERSAGFLALGLGRGSGRPAAVVTTSGTAAVNLHPAVVEADAGRVPMLALTADRPPELRHAGANQTIDQLRLYGDAVRWFCEVGVAEDRAGSNAYWRSTVCRAVAEATGLSWAPGPVHLNLAFREPTVPVSDDGRTRASPFGHDLDGRDGGRPWTRVQRPGTTPAPSDAVVAALADRIATTPRGLLVVGDAPTRPPVTPSRSPRAATVPRGVPSRPDPATTDGPFQRLAAAAGWPLLAEPTSDERRGDAAIATYHHLLASPGFAAGRRPDLVVRVGRQILSSPLSRLLGGGVEQVVVDDDGWPDPQRAAEHLVVADPHRVCDVLAEWVAAQPRPAASAWLDGWRAADRRARAAIDGMLDDDDVPSEPRTARDVAAAVPDGGTLVIGSSMPIRDLDAVMAPRALRVVGNRGASGIDGLVSTALGVALATAPAATVALTGDLSLLHDSNGLLLTPDAGPPDCVLVVVHNDGGGIFHFLPQADHPAGFERVFATPHGRDLARLAASHDVAHCEVTRAAELPAAVTRAITAGGIHLVEVRTDRRANAHLHDRLQATVDAAVAGLGEPTGPP